MKVQRDKLQQYQKRITAITDRETQIARECLRNNQKDKALLALRRKKYQESLLTKTDQQLAQLQALTSDVEFALVQKDVVFGLQQGTAVLKEIHKEMGGLEKVEMILEESAEAHAYQKVRPGLSAVCLVRIEIDVRMGRKSTTCLAARCRTRMRTKWRMSWRLWSVKLRRQMQSRLCLMRLLEYKSLCQMHLSTIRRVRKHGLKSGQQDGRLRNRWRHDRPMIRWEAWSYETSSIEQRR